MPEHDVNLQMVDRPKRTYSAKEWSHDTAGIEQCSVDRKIYRLPRNTPSGTNGSSILPPAKRPEGLGGKKRTQYLLLEGYNVCYGDLDQLDNATTAYSLHGTANYEPRHALGGTTQR